MSDTFDRADSAEIGNGWTETDPAIFSIVGNKLRGVSAESTSYDRFAWAPPADEFYNGTYSVDFFVTVAGAFPELGFRMSKATPTGYIIYVDENTNRFGIGTLNGPTYTELTGQTIGGGGITINTNYRFTLTGNGNALTATLYNIDTDTLIATLNTNNATYSDTGVGVTINNTGAGYVEYDNFVATPANNAPTDIDLSNSSISAGAGANAVVGTLSTTDADVGDSHTYTLVAGTGDTNNASFNILGDQLRCTDPAALGAGNYSVRIQSNDGTDSYQEAFAVTITAGATTITDVTSSAGADTAALNSQLTITVVDNTGVTGVSVNGVALSNVVADVDGVTVTADLGLGVNANIGASVNVVVNNGAASAGYPVTVALPAGFSSVVLTAAYASLPVDSSFYGEAAYSALAVGDVWIHENLGNTISYDGELVVTADPELVVDTDVDGWFLDASDTYAADASITTDHLTVGNNAPTDITLSNSTISETAGANAVVGTLGTVDADGGDSHTYSLVAGTGDANNASFNILGDQLRCTNPAALGEGSYSVRIQSSDGTDVYAEAFTITLTAAPNNAPTDITLSANAILETAGANAVVGILGTVDADGGDSHTYSLVAGTGDANNASFNILGDQLRCTDPAALGVGSYSVRVQTNDGQATFAKAFTVNISAAGSDVTPPVISDPGPLTVIVPAGTTSVERAHPTIQAWIASVTATDETGPANPVVTHNIPVSINVAQSPFTAIFSATDTAGNVGQRSRTITITEAAGATLAVTESGRKGRFEQRDAAWYRIE